MTKLLVWVQAVLSLLVIVRLLNGLDVAIEAMKERDSEIEDAVKAWNERCEE